MRAQRMLFVAIFLGVVCVFSQMALAQSVYGNIKGTLTDIAGKPIAGARVTVSSVGKGTKYRTATDGSGFYAVNDVSPDDYSLRIEADGFKTYQNPLVTVYADNPTMVNPKLVKGSTAEVVNGSAADVSVLKIDRTDIATILSQRQVADLPLQQQNVSNLGILAPGAIPVAPTLAPVQNPQQGVYIDVNGQIFSGTAYQLDGTDNRDAIEGLVIINPNQDAISELKITTQNYGSEFGEATAGVVTAQTKSGSNALHGSLFGYRQTGWGQASDPYLLSNINHRTYKKNQFGGSIGGAIIKNRLFYFADYRGNRDTSGATLTLTVPTAQVHTTCVGPTAAPGADCNLSEYGVALTNPGTHLPTTNTIGWTLQGTVVDPTPDTTIPANNGCTASSCLYNAQVSQQMVYLLSFLPTPNLPGIVKNYQVTGAEPFKSDNSDLRLDYDAAQKLRLFARYSYDLFRQDGSPAFGSGGGLGANPDFFAGDARTANQSGSTGFSYSFSSGLLTDFRFGYLRYHLDLNAGDFGTFPLANPPSTYPNSAIVGLNNPSDIFTSGLPDIEMDGGFARYGYSSAVNNCNCPLREHEQQFQLVNNWTRLAGRHAIRWGADFRYIENLRLSSSDGGSNSRAGHLQFSNNTNYTSFTLGDFLVGLLDSFDRTYSDPSNPSSYNASEHQKRAFFYGEDTWRVSSRLTINYGLRWELYFPQTVNAGGFLLIPNNTLPPFGSASINEVGTSGVNSQGNVQNTYKNFGPRIGFAYQVLPKTVIRAGYGRSFDVGYGGSLFGIAATQNPPIAAHFQVRNGSGSGLVLNNNATSSFDISTYTNFTITPTPNSLLTSLTVQALCGAQVSNGAVISPTPAQAPTCIPGNLDTLGAPVSGSALYALPTRIRVPTVDAWNLTLQHELTPDMYLEIAYVGNKGTHVLTDSTPYYDLNASQLPVAQQPSQKSQACRSVYPASYTGTNYCLPTAAASTPFTPWIFPVNYFGNNASDNYNSLQATLSKRFSRGYSVLAHYIYSKVLDYDSSYFAVDPTIGYGPGSFDRRHSFSMANIWSLPFGRGHALLGNISNAADKVVGGWSLNAITAWYGGLPFSPTYGANECSNDLSADSSATPPCRPNLVSYVAVTGNRNQYFTTTGGAPLTPAGTTPTLSPHCGLDSSGNPLAGAAIGPWQRPGCGQLGNAGRNSLRGPQFFQSDIALMKEIPITERVNLRFRADAFNIINKVNLGLPNTQVDAAQGAGAITTIAPGAIQRQWEFSARLQF
jgi:hypothetical protein